MMTTTTTKASVMATSKAQVKAFTASIGTIFMMNILHTLSGSYLLLSLFKMEQSTLSADYLIYSVSASVIIEQKKDYSVGFCILCMYTIQFFPLDYSLFFHFLSRNFEMSTIKIQSTLTPSTKKNEKLSWQFHDDVRPLWMHHYQFHYHDRTCIATSSVLCIILPARWK